MLTEKMLPFSRQIASILIRTINTSVIMKSLHDYMAEMASAGATAAGGIAATNSGLKQRERSSVTKPKSRRRKRRK
jgi:hypothetical protein